MPAISDATGAHACVWPLSAAAPEQVLASTSVRAGMPSALSRKLLIKSTPHAHRCGWIALGQRALSGMAARGERRRAGSCHLRPLGLREKLAQKSSGPPGSTLGRRVTRPLVVNSRTHVAAGGGWPGSLAGLCCYGYPSCPRPPGLFSLPLLLLLLRRRRRRRRLLLSLRFFNVEYIYIFT